MGFRGGVVGKAGGGGRVHGRKYSRIQEATHGYIGSNTLDKLTFLVFGIAGLCCD